MDRTTRFVLVLVVAVALASLASYAVYRAVTRIPVREIEVRSTQVVVAARPVAVGALLTKDDVKLVPWPERAVVPNGFTSVDAVVNRGVLDEFSENEPLTEGRLAPVGSGGGLPPTIKPGMRALSIKVNEVIGVAGFVVPGTHVDLIVTAKGSAGRDETMSRIVVSNLEVLTAGTRYDQEQARQDGKAVPTTVVTLLVTPEDAERIALAQNEGQLSLALRNPLDTLPVETKGARMAALMGAPGPPPVETKVAGRPVMRRPKPVEAPPAPKVYTVETIRGAKRTEETIK